MIALVLVIPTWAAYLAAGMLFAACLLGLILWIGADGGGW